MTADLPSLSNLENASLQALISAGESGIVTSSVYGLYRVVFSFCALSGCLGFARQLPLPAFVRRLSRPEEAPALAFPLPPYPRADARLQLSGPKEGPHVLPFLAAAGRTDVYLRKKRRSSGRRRPGGGPPVVVLLSCCSRSPL